LYRVITRPAADPFKTGMGTRATSVLPAYIFILYFEPRLMNVLSEIPIYESSDCGFTTVTGARNLSRVSRICKIESRIGFGKLRPTPHWCLGPG
jgi:hypothetical protein